MFEEGWLKMHFFWATAMAHMCSDVKHVVFKGGMSLGSLNVLSAVKVYITAIMVTEHGGPLHWQITSRCTADVVIA